MLETCYTKSTVLTSGRANTTPSPCLENESTIAIHSQSEPRLLTARRIDLSLYIRKRQKKIRILFGELLYSEWSIAKVIIMKQPLDNLSAVVEGISIGSIGQKSIANHHWAVTGFSPYF